MKLLLSLLLTLLLLAGCAAGPAKAPAGEAATEEAAVTEVTEVTEAPAESPSIPWPEGGEPVRLFYGRRWEYGADAETEDPELMGQIARAVQALEVGPPSDTAVCDFTDLLTFTFADGSRLSLEFEDQCWVADRDHRYVVTDLGPLRQLLDQMMRD